MSRSVEQRVMEIFMAVFALEDQDISALTKENYDRWDSMAQTSLAICIEEEFGLSLEYETVEEFDSFEYIVAFLESQND